MTGSLKAKPLHAVPAAPLGLMGDQWAVDSNSRTERQIWGKDTRDKRRAHTQTRQSVWHARKHKREGRVRYTSQQKQL